MRYNNAGGSRVGYRVRGVRAVRAGLSGRADRADPGAAGPEAVGGPPGADAGAGGTGAHPGEPPGAGAVPDRDAERGPGAAARRGLARAGPVRGGAALGRGEALAAAGARVDRPGPAARTAAADGRE